MKITVSVYDPKKLESYFQMMTDPETFHSVMGKVGQYGKEQLSAATPVDTAQTASKWEYWTVDPRGRFPMALTWTNDSRGSNGVPIVLLRQYGHGTRGGTHVPGVDFINPAMWQVYDMFDKEFQRAVQAVRGR